MDIGGYETKHLASSLHSLSNSSSSSCQSRKDTVHLISVFFLAQTDNIHEQYCKITVSDAFTVQLEYLCYYDHILWTLQSKYSTFLLRFEIMYNQTMIKKTISSRGKYLKKIKDIQLYKRRRNKALQMASMLEYKKSINIVH